jgi:hypothetical protein
MDFKKRITLGAIGGITPYLVTLLSIDFKSAIGGYETLDWVGLTVRCIVLIFLGSLVAYLHQTEKEPFKLFQLGLAAPALLAVFINGNIGNNQVLPTPVGNVNLSMSIGARVAYAADDIYLNDGMLKEPKVSGFSRFLRGALGTKLKTSEGDAYFVIVGSHKNREDAEKQVEKLSKIDYKASVYNPYGFSKYYAVVIASNVTKDEAIRIKEKAIEDGLPPDSYVWTY